jgi:hypothetical protein
MLEFNFFVFENVQILKYRLKLKFWKNVLVLKSSNFENI